MKCLSILLVLAFAHYEAIYACDVARCPGTQIHVCTSTTSFQGCPTAGGVPNAELTFNCPAGTVCVNEKQRCKRDGVAVCQSGCNICNDETAASCLSKTVYAFCFDGVADPSVNGTCKTGEVCVATKPELCTPASPLVAPSCNQDEATPPTPSTPTASTPAEVTQLCQLTIKMPGKFPTSDCHKYNYCYPSQGKLVGQQYQCPGNTMFNCATQQCGKLCNNACPVPKAETFEI